jgi:Short C-terminal domain
MSGRRNPAVIMLIIAIVTMVISILGLIGSILLNVFVFDKFNAYGQVPVPGSASLQLPAGEVTISFHTQVFGSASGGLPIPNLGIAFDGPDGVADPVLTEDLGSTTSVNNDVRRRIWIAQIPADGHYQVTTTGDVGPFFNPQLAFGRPGSLGWLPWVFGVLLPLAVVDFVISVVWVIRSSRASTPDVPEDTWPPEWGEEPDWDATDPEPDKSETWEPTPYTPPDYPGAQSVAEPSGLYAPTGQAIRIEQIKHLAALRDSGALTQDEFEDEKRRVLDGY